MYFDRNSTNKLHAFGPLKRFFLRLMQLLLCYWFAWAGLSHGAPALMTRFFGNELSGNFKVISKEDGKFRWQDRCNGHAVYVKLSGASSDTKLCLDYFFWNDLSVGDALSLNLKRSALGDLVVSFGRNG
jgi:hypothetical protein